MTEFNSCETCFGAGAVEWPESPFPCPDCRPAEHLAGLVDYGFPTDGEEARRAARKVLGWPEPATDSADEAPMSDDEKEKLAEAMATTRAIAKEFANWSDSRIQHVPRRDDAVAAWIKEQRDRFPGVSYNPQWSALDDLLDLYRLHADTGTPLDRHACSHGHCCEGGDPEDVAQQIPLPPEPPTQGDVSAWLVERFGPTRSLTAQFHKLISEVGELSDALLGRTEGFPPPAEGWDQNFRDEAADVVLVVMALAVTEGFDLQEAIASKWSRRKRGAVPAEGGDSNAR